MANTFHSLLFYSEWLDARSLLVEGPETHEQLVTQFLDDNKRENH